MYGFDVSGLIDSKQEVMPEDFPWWAVGLAVGVAIVGAVTVAVFWTTILKYVFRK